ncbi:MAG: AAA family ATPase [Candidatus Heimdallarchaeota archaeon]|nr:AAA family ATPase [Candidatus Heimdallarchaeota archaeon]
MKRNIEIQLEMWKKSVRRKPLILQGARQVGKTYSILEFGKKFYSHIAYFNFEEDKNLNSLFTGDINPERIISTLSLSSGMKIERGKTLIFFDEIQESNRALNSLKYFTEKAADYHVVAAGSLLGIQLSRPASFPVGKVNFLTLYPLSSYEFLDAMEKTNLRMFLEDKKDFSPIPDIIHNKFIDFAAMDIKASLAIEKYSRAGEVMNKQLNEIMRLSVEEILQIKDKIAGLVEAYEVNNVY